MRFILTLCAALLFGVLLYAIDSNAAATDGYTLCAAENAVCKITAPSTVIYGAGDTWSAPKAFAADTPCTNAVFTDPINGIVKACWIKAGVESGYVYPCGKPSSPELEVLYEDLMRNGALYSCAPSPGGTGTSVTVRGNSSGVTAWWYCRTEDPRAKRRWNPSWATATAARLTSSAFVSDAYAVLTADDKLAKMNELAKKNIDTAVEDPELAKAFCPFFPEMFNNVPPDSFRIPAPPAAAAAQLKGTP